MAENTPNLNLYLKDPIADGNDTFNIETMLNENFRKIDSGIAAKPDLDEVIPLASRGAANGVASLDSTGKVPSTQSRISSVNNKTGTVVLGSEDINKITTKTLTDLPAAYPDGYSVFSVPNASLDAWKTSAGHTDGIAKAIVETIKITTDYMIVQRVIFYSSLVADGIAGEYERSSSANNSWSGPWKKVVTMKEFTSIQNEVAAHTADDAIDAHNASNISFVPPVGMTATDVQQAIAQAFQQANDIKVKWASVVGSPLLASDTQAQLQTKTQSIKTALATNLSNKGQPSVNTETLTALINKIPNISTGVKKATGVVTSSSTALMFNNQLGTGYQMYYLDILFTDIGFAPSVIYGYVQNKAYGNSTLFVWMKENFYDANPTTYANAMGNLSNWRAPKLADRYRIPVVYNNVPQIWIAVE